MFIVSNKNSDKEFRSCLLFFTVKRKKTPFSCMSADKNRQRLRLALGMQWLKRKEMRNKAMCGMAMLIKSWGISIVSGETLNSLSTRNDRQAFFPLIYLSIYLSSLSFLSLLTQSLFSVNFYLLTPSV